MFGGYGGGEHMGKRQPRLALKQGTVQRKTGDCPQVSRY